MATISRKLLVIEGRSSTDEPGFLDLFTLYTDDEECRLLHACPGRLGPNHRSPLLVGGKPWRECYGKIDKGQRISGRVVRHWRYGLCILLNEGGNIRSENPNPRHGGARIIREAFVHKAQSDTWAGSAGCPTTPPVHWASLERHLTEGDFVWVQIL
jgi:hypothetical protein